MALLIGEFVMVLLLIVAAIGSRKYGTNCKTKDLSFFYPVSALVVDKLGIVSLYIRKGKQVNELSALSVGKSRKEVVRDYLIRLVSTLYAVSLMGLILALLTGFLPEQESELKEGYLIERPEVNAGSKFVDLKIHLKEKGYEFTHDYPLEVRGRKLTKEEFVQEVERQKEYVAKEILGDNPSAENIRSRMNLFTELPDSPLSIRWRISNTSVIGWDGELGEDIPADGVLVTITACFVYEEEEAFEPMEFMVYPEEKSWQDSMEEQMIISLEHADEITSTGAVYQLPRELNDCEITYEEKTQDRAGMVLLLVFIMVVFAGAHISSGIKKQTAKRELELLLDYPEIIHKFTLLMSAGMTVKRAWERIVEDDRKKHHHKRFAYEEMQLTLREMNNGTPEMEAIGAFGNRIGLLPYQKFSSLLVQNMKKGTKELLVLLEYESSESFRERKETAKRLGEEAGTKMLFPMLLMMAIVFAIIMVPAVMKFSI